MGIDYQAAHRAQLRHMADACIAQIQSDICSGPKYDGEHDELLEHLKSEYVNEMTIERAKRLLSVFPSKVTKLFKLLADAVNRKPDTCLRFPAIENMPETRWKLHGSNLIQVSMSKWQRPGDMSKPMLPPPVLFRVYLNGDVEYVNHAIQATAAKVLEELVKAPESYMRSLGRKSNTCPVCRRFIAEENMKKRGIHPTCEAVMGFEVGEHKNTFTNKLVHRQQNKKDNRVKKRHLEEAESVFKKKA